MILKQIMETSSLRRVNLVPCFLIFKHQAKSVLLFQAFHEFYTEFIVNVVLVCLLIFPNRSIVSSALFFLLHLNRVFGFTAFYGTIWQKLGLKCCKIYKQILASGAGAGPPKALLFKY